MLKPGNTEKLIIFLLSKKKVMPVKEVVGLLKYIKISESAVRATLFRLKNKGLIKAVRKGREALFSLAESGREFEADYMNRLERSEKKWNEKWLLVSFNVPEKKRKLRNILREELIFHGFGRLNTNLWISPYDLTKECKIVIERLGVKEYTAIFITDYIGADAKALVYRAWDLGRLEKKYLQLKEKYEKQYMEFKKIYSADPSSGALEAIRRYLKLKEEAVKWGTKEPFLPKELLPSNWIIFELKDLFYKYLQLLYDKMSSLVGFDFSSGKK